MTIKKLTPEQEAQIPAFRDECLKKALNTERLNRDNAAEAVKTLYEVAGFAAPEILFFESPYAALVARGEKLGLKGKGRHESLWFLSAWDYFWLAPYLFAQKIGVNYGELQSHLDAYVAYAENCGVMYAYEGIAFVSERPTKIKFDNENLLHCEDGPALEFPDGYNVCSWHGIRVPREWILENAVTPEIAFGWENTEQRRCACEIYGWVRLLENMDARIIDTDSDPFIGTLYEADVPNLGKEKLLKVKCGTGREFAIPVSPHHKTAISAQVEIRGLPEAVIRLAKTRT